MLKVARQATRHVEGMIDPERMYTRDGVYQAIGIGEDELMKGRRAGVIKAYQKGKYVYYHGRDVIAWIEASSG